MITFQLVAEAQEKKALKAAAQERAQACKDKQAKAKVKEAERERRRNEENIRRECYFSSTSLS